MSSFYGCRVGGRGGTFTLSFKCADIRAEFNLKTRSRSRTRTRTSTEDKTGVCRQISMWAPGFQEKPSDPDETKRSSRAAGGGSFNQSFTLQELFRLLRLAASCCAALSGSRVQHTQEGSVYRHSSHTAFTAGV